MSHPFCPWCEQFVDRCDYCGREFEVEDTVICCSIVDAYYHFCNEECLNKFLDENITQDEVTLEGRKI